MSTIAAQRNASVASLQNYERAKGKAAQVAAAKAAALAAKSAPVKPVETPTQIVESQEHKAEAQASTEAIHRLQVAQAQGHPHVVHPHLAS